MARASNEAIQRILDVHFPNATTAINATWGRGVFWKGISQVEVIGCDLEKARARDVVAECGHLPFKNRAFDIGVLDLPFMHDVSPHNGTGLYDCYRGVGNWQRFVDLTVLGARELERVCRQGYAIKCKDGVDSGHYRPIMASLVEALGAPSDLLVFIPDVVLQVDPKWSRVVHFRRRESYFLVYK